MPSSHFIQKLALAFLEYKKELRAQECSSSTTNEPNSSAACKSPCQCGCCSSSATDQPCSHGTQSVATAASPTPTGSALHDDGSLAAYLEWLRLHRVSAKFGKGLGSAALLLRVEHWLEAGDDKHRHGSNLKPYFSVFLDSQRASRDAAALSGGLSPRPALPDSTQQALTPHPQPPGPEGAATPARGSGGREQGAVGDIAAAVSSGTAACHLAASCGTSAVSPTPLLCITPPVPFSTAKGEPAGGWQQVLEAVAASTYRRSGSGSLRLIRRSIGGIGGSDMRRSRTTPSARHDTGGTSSEPATRGVSRSTSVAADLCAAGEAPDEPEATALTPGSTAAGVSRSLHLHSNCMDGTFTPSPMPSPFGPRSLPGATFSCQQLSRLVEDRPWSEDGTQALTDRQHGSQQHDDDRGSEQHSTDSLAQCLVGAHSSEGSEGEDDEDYSWGYDSDSEGAGSSRHDSDTDNVQPAGVEGSPAGEGQPANQASLELQERMARCDFFAWLDHGEGKQLDLAHMGVSREKLERESVRYLSADELPEFEVVVDKEKGLLKYSASGQALHTFSSPQGTPKQLPQEATASQEPAAKGSTVAPTEAKKWIWVVAPNGRLYVAQKVRGQFHHSSFLCGAAVLAAGNLQARHGRLVKLTADSGHYWPKADHFRWFYEHLLQQGADLSGLQGLEFRTKH